MGEVEDRTGAALADEVRRRANRDRVVARLVREGASVGDAIQFADLWLQYSEASENIVKNGTIVQHPRTLNPITNPYVAHRDSARAGMRRLSWIEAGWLRASLTRASRVRAIILSSLYAAGPQPARFDPR
jgi:hypothetical protein